MPQNNKGHIWQTHSKHPQGWKTESIFFKSQTRQGSPLSPLLFNTVLEVLVIAIREDKDIKGIQIKKEVKLSLFADDMILYTENPKDATKIIRTNQWNSKVTWYKSNAQKSLSFLCNNNETSEIEIKEIIPFTITIKRIKYLGINLPKEKKDLYAENYKTLMKEMKEHKQMERYTMFLDWKNQ